MRTFFIATAILALSGPALACTLPADRPHDSAFTLANDLSTSTFVEEVTDAIGDDVMGYGVVLRNREGRIVAHITHGWAQSPCESGGGRPFTLDTVTPWGSVTKMVTTAAVLNKIRRFRSKTLDDRMVDYLPLRWEPGCNGRGDCWNDVRIRHLLSYQGGFRGSVDQPYSVRLQSGTTERDVGERKYSNENFGIWNYMGAFFAEGRMHQIDEAYNGPAESYDPVMFTATRGIWTDYLKNQIFEPLGIRGACAAVDFAGPDHVLLYNYKQGDGADETGYKPNAVDTPNCTSGGIVMSLRDMSTFVHALANTGKVIRKRQYENLLARTDEHVFGWNGDRPSDDRRMHWKAGASTKQGGHLGAHVMAFSSGYTAVIATNSFPRDGTQWKRHTVIRDAFNAARGASTGILSDN